MRIVIIFLSSGVSAAASENGNRKFYRCNQEFELCAFMCRVEVEEVEDQLPVCFKSGLINIALQIKK